MIPFPAGGFCAHLEVSSGRIRPKKQVVVIFNGVTDLARKARRKGGVFLFVNVFAYIWLLIGFGICMPGGALLSRTGGYTCALNRAL